MDAKEAVLKALKDSGEPMRPGDIAAAAGMEKDDLPPVNSSPGSPPSARRYP